jgi:hypothetical protein
MQLSALQARCRTRFRDPNQNIVTDTEWTDYLNDAYRDVIAASPHWPFLETVNCSALVVAANTRSVALPTDVTRVLAVRNATDGFPMRPLLSGTKQHLYLDPEQNMTGVPEWYRVIAGRIEVWPLPTTPTTLHVEYPAPPSLLAGASDEPVFPEQYHHILVEGALQRAYLDDGNLEQAAVHADQYGSILGNMLLDLVGTAQEDSYPTIVDDWYV